MMTSLAFNEISLEKTKTANTTYASRVVNYGVNRSCDNKHISIFCQNLRNSSCQLISLASLETASLST